MARYLLAPFGSAGDVNPFVWLGMLLQSRGHEVTLLTTPLFRPVVEKAGLDFVPVGEAEEYTKLLSHPDLWKPWAGTMLVFKTALRAMRAYYEELASRIRDPRETVLVAPVTVFAARAAREKFRVPLVTTHLQPIAMLSACDQTVLFPGLEWISRLPMWFKKLLLKAPSPADWRVTRPVRRFMAELELPAPRRLFPRFPGWLHSPDANLLLFPEWFAPRQPDWPANAVAAGFPLSDLKEHFTLPDRVQTFLDQGEKPVLLSPGTGNSQAKAFFAEGLAACQRMGLRALLGTPYPEQLPQPLPSSALAFDYLPFSQLLPQTCAFVHHAGIGTLSQAFAAGIPQVHMPMSHDQPDNARRAQLLGVSVEIPRKSFTADRIVAALERLLKNPGVMEACRSVAEKTVADRAADTAIRVVEQVRFQTQTNGH